MKLYIFSSLIPLSLGLFFKSEKWLQATNILAVIIGVASLVANVLLKPDIPLLIPALALLSIYLVQKVKDKKFDVYEFLGVLMVSQALLLDSFGQVMALAFAADLFFCFTQENAKKYFNMALTWLPVICGRLINDKGEFVDVLLAVTIVLRSFDWPIKLNSDQGAAAIQVFISRVVIPVALWRSVEITMPQFWIGFWMSMPLFFAWGASSRVVLALTTLSLWTVSHQWGVLTVALWPAFFLEGAAVILYGALVTLMGTLANIQNIELKEEVGWALVGLEAFVISRVVASLFFEKTKQNIKESSALVFLSLAVLCGAGSFIAIEDIQWQPQGYVFAALVIALAFIGYFLAQKKKKLFAELRSLQPIEAMIDWIEKTRLYNYKSSPQTVFFENKWLNKTFEAIESEGYVVILLACVIGFFVWSTQ